VEIDEEFLQLVHVNCIAGACFALGLFLFVCCFCIYVCLFLFYVRGFAFVSLFEEEIDE